MSIKLRGIWLQFQYIAITNNILPVFCMCLAFKCNPPEQTSYADPEACNQFFVCINEEEIVLATCPNGLHYSTQFSTCLPPEDANCETGKGHSM